MSIDKTKQNKIWKTLKFELNLCLPYKLKFKG